MEIWLNGPSFLQEDQSNWPKDLSCTYPCIPDNDIELKKEIAVNVAITDTVNELISYFSDWLKLRRAVAWLLRYKCYCRRKYLNHDMEPNRGNLTCSELERATTEILVNIQIKHFSEEFGALKKGIVVKKNSRLAGLNPFIDNNIIRTKGRVNKRETQDCQVILPDSSHVTTLIIRFYHEINGHVGKQQVLAETRRKYWILTGPSAVKRIIGHCVLCKRRCGPTCSQQMAPLLKEQTTPDKPPFTYIGIDYFGPLTVRSGRCNLKRYGCLFTCLTSRAIHLEVAHSLTTDSFIAAFQRFVSRRGVPEKVFSDNGTNLVSGDRSLRKSIEQWNQSKIGKVMTQNEIDWHFNPPTSKHMGGAWERLIRSTRNILKALAKEQLLTDEQLLTLMTEVEKILNDRPITAVSNDSNNPMVLSPYMLLLMKSNECLPQGLFRKEDIHAQRWWKQIQYLANIFWRRWIREYLPALQVRQKWLRRRRDLQVDDVVLITQENVPRGQWPLGRVIRANLGRDGLVRSCVVKCRNNELIRPITKLCLLEFSE